MFQPSGNDKGSRRPRLASVERRTRNALGLVVRGESADQATSTACNKSRVAIPFAGTPATARLKTY